MMKVVPGVAAVPVVVLLSAVLAGAASAKPPLVADAASVCDSCAEWNADREPFRVFGNTYYVGVAGLSSVLITSNDGHVLIDAQACNAPGSPYNNTSIDQASAQAAFADCAAANQVATHTVTLELHDDQHNPVLDASGHQIMSAVSFSTHL